MQYKTEKLLIRKSFVLLKTTHTKYFFTLTVNLRNDSGCYPFVAIKIVCISSQSSFSSVKPMSKDLNSKCIVYYL